tara:strand:+ start:1691 stop:1987 length:297 start_codon:yes stop_codon:yes gene_type:complete
MQKIKDKNKDIFNKHKSEMMEYFPKSNIITFFYRSPFVCEKTPSILTVYQIQDDLLKEYKIEKIIKSNAKRFYSTEEKMYIIDTEERKFIKKYTKQWR